MTCGNPDCLYLHDVGSQEDSFTKDEIISAYTRTRVPQMASGVSQRRTGTVLPPPGDDFSYSAVVSAKHTFKNGTLNTTSQPRLSPPNSSSGRSTLPSAASWGQRDLNARTTATGATSSQSHTKPKSESQSNPFSSSSVFSCTKTPSSWNDDTSTAAKISEGQQLSEKESRTLQPYKPGISKETQALSSLESSLDIDFSTIPSAWNDDDIVVPDVMPKGSDENQVANKNECQSSHTAVEKMLEDIGSKDTDMEKLSAQISSVTLGGNDEIQSMAGNQQPDVMPCTSVDVLMDQNFGRDLAHPNPDELLLPSENKDSIVSCQYSSDKRLDWSLEMQNCSVTPLNDRMDSALLTDKIH
ncbi:RNA binding (RRM/RBD/RNP motifs) family protein, partial [Zea mays]